MIGIISGSGLYELQGLEIKEQKVVNTPYGAADVSVGIIGAKDIAFIARHGKNHELLPNTINYRANIFALKELGVRAIIATSVMGILDASSELASVILFDDIYFPENRLPNGEACTFYTNPGEQGRGHYIFTSPFSSHIRAVAARVAAGLGIRHKDRGTYGHVNGPRFNSKAEIRQLQSMGVTAISQTCGPEAVLAGELEIPYQLIGFGVDYANGVTRTPTPVEILDENLRRSAEVIPRLVKAMVDKIDAKSLKPEGFVYRFE